MDNKMQIRNSKAEFLIFTSETGEKYKKKRQFYSLDAIISVGFKVNTTREVQFRQWAVSILKNYSIREYALDHDRMENGAFLGEDYFEQLLDEIRKIRAS